MVREFIAVFFTSQAEIVIDVVNKSNIIVIAAKSDMPSTILPTTCSRVSRVTLAILSEYWWLSSRTTFLHCQPRHVRYQWPFAALTKAVRSVVSAQQGYGVHMWATARLWTPLAAVSHQVPYPTLHATKACIWCVLRPSSDGPPKKSYSVKDEWKFFNVSRKGQWEWNPGMNTNTSWQFSTYSVQQNMLHRCTRKRTRTTWSCTAFVTLGGRPDSKSTVSTLMAKANSRRVNGNKNACTVLLNWASISYSRAGLVLIVIEENWKGPNPPSDKDSSAIGLEFRSACTWNRSITSLSSIAASWSFLISEPLDQNDII